MCAHHGYVRMLQGDPACDAAAPAPGLAVRRGGKKKAGGGPEPGAKRSRRPAASAAPTSEASGSDLEESPDEVGRTVGCEEAGGYMATSGFEHFTYRRRYRKIVGVNCEKECLQK